MVIPLIRPLPRTIIILAPATNCDFQDNNVASMNLNRGTTPARMGICLLYIYDPSTTRIVAEES